MHPVAPKPKPKAARARAKAAPRRKAISAKQSGGGGGVGAEYEFTVHGAPAFGEVEFVLRPGQELITDGGALSYMREGVERGTLKVGGLGAMLGRALGGESLFLVKYTGKAGEKVGQRRVTISSAYPGDILALELQPGERAIISRDSFLASSPNVRVTGKLNWRGAFEWGQEEGLVLPQVVNEGPGKGYVWLGSYGNFRKHELADASQVLLVDNGMFLAVKRPVGGTVPYKVTKLGKSFVSSFFGGEGLGMEFRGPDTVYTQSHNFNDLAQLVGSRLPQRD